MQDPRDLLRKSFHYDNISLTQQFAETFSMPLHSDWLPVATPHDPAEDPPGSLDPLGTLLQAERLAEILLPGFTARMWRGRLLTITTLAAHVADRVVIRMNSRDDVRLEARLADSECAARLRPSNLRSQLLAWIGGQAH